MTGWNASEDRMFRPQLRKAGDSDGEEEEEEEEEDWDILDEPGEEAAPEPAPAAASSASSASAKQKEAPPKCIDGWRVAYRTEFPERAETKDVKRAQVREPRCALRS